VKTPLLREWREAQGETQSTLAALSGITEATISRIENGAPLRPSTAKKLADALGVSVVDLMNNPPVPAGKAEAPTTGQAVLLEDALNAARRGARSTFRAELRALDFPDEHFEDFLWPLVSRVAEQEREISRLTERLAAPAALLGDAASEAQETVEGARARAREVEEVLGRVARATEEATERVAQEARERAANG
jgi:transcriptional regulator with XRE-family HTH domain